MIGIKLLALAIIATIALLPAMCYLIFLALFRDIDTAIMAALTLLTIMGYVGLAWQYRVFKQDGEREGFR